MHIPKAIRSLHLLVAVFVPAVSGIVVGLFVSAITLSHRRGFNFMIRFLGNIGTLIAGIRVNINGTIAAQSRPCVFIFNHQSGLDPILLCHVLQHDITAIAKTELKHNPITGPLLSFGKTIFIDRIDENSRKQAYQPAFEALQQGRSIVIAPEGTRVNNRVVGPFKLGAFNIAAAANVAIVPIVILDAKKCLAAKSNQLYPGTIHIEILDPIEAHTIQQNIDQCARSLEAIYREKLTAGISD